MAKKVSTTNARNSCQKFECAVWYFNTDNSSSSSWTPFGDIENKIIEEAFSQNRKSLELDRCFIDFEKSIQIDKQNSSIQQSIKRSIHRSEEQPVLRSERFYIPQKLAKSFTDGDSSDNRFINEWKIRNRKMSTDEKLEKAAEGVLKEGAYLGQVIEAEWIAKQLRSVKAKSNEEIDMCLISLYTHESFLYRLINSTLRSNDQTKLETLGPFAHLLFNCDCSSTMKQFGYSGVLYRGAQLDEETIDSYKQAIGSKKTWDAFSSTSKDRRKAECFGNVLFIIDLAKSARYRFSGMDISSLSQYPEEEEVLIRAVRNFIVEKVERDNTTGKYFIYLSLC